MTAFITATVISAGVGAYNAKRGRDATKQAANTILSAEEQSIEEQRRQYNQTREDWAPWREAGENALYNMENADTEFETSPGYNWRLNEGVRGMDNAFSVKGGGGNAMRALTEYNQNFASNEFGNWWGRQSSMAGFGSQGNQGTQIAGQNMANQNQASRFRSGEDRASIGLYGAQQQADYTNSMMGDLLTAGQGIYNKFKTPNKPGGGATTQPVYDFQGRKIKYT